jgi:hypothetical protein
MKLVMLITAFFATLYASASFVCQFDGDFKVSALAAILALGAVIGLEHRDRKRAWLADYREQVWARRDREAGL